MTVLQHRYWSQRRMLSKRERDESLEFHVLSDAYFNECVTTLFLMRQLMRDRGSYNEKIEENAKNLINSKSMIGISRALEIINGDELDNFNARF